MKVSQEEYLDMVTAISGSGPAYFMLVLEALTDAGVHLGMYLGWALGLLPPPCPHQLSLFLAPLFYTGLPRRMARQLVIETMHGSAQLARETGDHPAFLRENITSPGGTTAAALFACEEGGLRTVLQKAVWSAYRYVGRAGFVRKRRQPDEHRLTYFFFILSLPPADRLKWAGRTPMWALAASSNILPTSPSPSPAS